MSVSGIEKIVDSILAEAHEKVQSIEHSANNDAEKIIEDTKKRANEKSADIIAQGKTSADLSLERRLSVYALSLGRLELAKKREMLDIAFSNALAKINAYNKEEYLALIEKLMAKIALENGDVIMISERERYIDEAFLSKYPFELQSERSADVANGFILKRNGMFIDATLIAAVAELKNDIEPEIAQILFS